MQSGLIFLQDTVTPLHELVDPLPADPEHLGRLRVRQIVLYNLLVHAPLVLRQQLPVKIIQKGLLQNLIHVNHLGYHTGKKDGCQVFSVDKLLFVLFRLVLCMHKIGLLNFLVNEDPKGRLDSARGRIEVHRSTDSAENVEGKWLKAYCDYFGCSADFLFAYIDAPTKEETDITAEIGLDRHAISTLKQLIQYDENLLKFINYTLKDTRQFIDFLDNLSLYLQNDYTTVLRYDKQDNAYIDCTQHMLCGDSIMFGKEMIDNKGNPGWAIKGVSTKILESHAMLQILDTINEWKRNYSTEN